MRTPRHEKAALTKGLWSKEEDQKLIAYIKKYGIWNWREMSKYAGLSRTGKSCRLRWVNYLNPDIKRGNITKEEEETIINMYEMIGSRWSIIAERFPGRTDNEIKNYWHGHLKKRLRDNMSSRTETQEVNISNCEAKLLNSHVTTNITVVIDPNASNSYGPSDIGDCFSSSTAPTFGVDEIQKIEENISSSEIMGELQSFWEQPFSWQNLYMEDNPATFYDIGFNHPNPQEWWQEPTSPYGSSNNEYWFTLLFQAEMIEMEKFNAYT